MSFLCKIPNLKELHIKICFISTILQLNTMKKKNNNKMIKVHRINYDIRVRLKNI
jgi:hypothetical protein